MVLMCRVQKTSFVLALQLDQGLAGDRTEFLGTKHGGNLLPSMTPLLDGRRWHSEMTIARHRGIAYLAQNAFLG